MKGSISEFELGVIRARMHEAARSKARRGELRIPTPIGYTWDRSVGLTFDPDRRLQDVNGTLNLTRVCRMWQLGTDPAARCDIIPARGNDVA